jgi:hypothetical protein
VGRVTAAGLRPALRYSEQTASRILNDYWWGSSPLPVTVPFGWIASPANWVEDPPLNVAQISGTPGASASDPASINEYGESTFAVTLASDTAADSMTLAHWVLAYYATQPNEVPRVRFMGLRFVLNFRSPEEIRTLLSVKEGRRISITGTPATWPTGAQEQLVEGIAHSADSEGGRFLDWITSPVIGVVPGVPGPWFQLDSSFLGGEDEILF